MNGSSCGFVDCYVTEPHRHATTTGDDVAATLAAENERLTALLDEAPHDVNCHKRDKPGYRANQELPDICNCWKAKIREVTKCPTTPSSGW